MNYLKKKLKPITNTLTSSANNSNFSRTTKKDKNTTDLEDYLYDDYIVEAPPHPSELLALGIDPSDIDANDSEKLKELYRKAKADGKASQTNSVLLAKQRQKLEIEEKKKTKEEWKFFDSITARVEQVVKQSQQTLEQLKESSAIEKLTEPEYDLRLSADEVFKSSGNSSQKVSQDKNSWVNFEDDDDEKINKALGNKGSEKTEPLNKNNSNNNSDGLVQFSLSGKDIVEELLEDFGLDLRSPEEQRKYQEEQQKKQLEVLKEQKEIQEAEKGKAPQNQSSKPTQIDLKKAVRPRPRPKKQEIEDPFDTSFVQAPATNEKDDSELQVEDDKASPDFEQLNNELRKEEVKLEPKVIDPFDTSYIRL